MKNKNNLFLSLILVTTSICSTDGTSEESSQGWSKSIQSLFTLNRPPEPSNENLQPEPERANEETKDSQEDINKLKSNTKELQNQFAELRAALDSKNKTTTSEIQSVTDKFNQTSTTVTQAISESKSAVVNEVSIKMQELKTELDFLKSAARTSNSYEQRLKEVETELAILKENVAKKRRLFIEAATSITKAIASKNTNPTEDSQVDANTNKKTKSDFEEWKDSSISSFENWREAKEEYNNKRERYFGWKGRWGIIEPEDIRRFNSSL